MNKNLVVRCADKVEVDHLLDLRKFPIDQEEQCLAFALDIFRACTEVDVFVWSESRNENIVSLTR